MFSSLALATLVIAFRAVADYRDFVRETGMAGVIGIPLHLFSIIIPALMLIYSLLVPFGAAGMIP